MQGTARGLLTLEGRRLIQGGVNTLSPHPDLTEGRRVLALEADALRALSDSLDARFVRAVELLGVEISKQQQTSDWGAAELSPDQLAYAASDVLHLHALWAKLEGLLKREGRLDLAEACFRFLPARGRLDLLGYEDPDIFHH